MVSGKQTDRRLREIYHRNGYMRFPKMDRRREEKTNYKKGWEVRLVVKSDEELERVRRMLAQAGLKPGRPFKKARQWALPVYGKQAVAFFEGAGRIHE